MVTPLLDVPSRQARPAAPTGGPDGPAPTSGPPAGTANAGVFFRVLGPLDVTATNGTAVPITSSRQQVILGVLVLEAGHVVPVERLIDAVWDERPPRTAKSQVQICVSALRRSLADAGFPGVIVTRSSGYQIRSELCPSDLGVFLALDHAGRAAVEQGRITDAVALFGRALGLWRGDPLAGARSRLVRAAATRLVERRMSMVEAFVDARLRIGGHDDLIGELMELTEAQPLRERLQGQLMTALARAGRRGEALATYRTARDASLEELGLEPSAELRRLEHAILVGDVHPERRSLVADAPTPTDRPSPRMLPADTSEFVGRAEQLDGLRAVLLSRSTAEGRLPPLVIALNGVIGAGKTALAVRLAHQVADGFPDGQLHADLSGVRGSSATAGDIVARFLRALGVPADTVPADPHERIEMYRIRTADRRLLVLLDAAADEAAVTPLLPAGPGSAAIVTSRRRLTGLAGAHHSDVDVLPAEDGIELLRTVIGRERLAATRGSGLRLVHLCGGLPLALRIAAARLAARRHWSLGHFLERLEERPLDELAHGGSSVRDVLADAYGRLPAEAAVLFRRLALVDTPGFARWVAAPLLGTGPDAAEEVLEDLAEGRLIGVEVAAGRTVRYRFHQLTRAYALERLAEEEPPEERVAALHRLLERWPADERRTIASHHVGEFRCAHPWRVPPADVGDGLHQRIDGLYARYEAALDALRREGETLSGTLVSGWPHWAAGQPLPAARRSGR